MSNFKEMKVEMPQMSIYYFSVIRYWLLKILVAQYNIFKKLDMIKLKF